ncbi:MAG: nucleoside deaminase [Elusimicrobiota bacterium]
MKNRNSYFMNKAKQLAKQAMDKNEIPVGAVVVDEDKIIGQGFNSQVVLNDPTGHAEIAALRDACKNKQNFRLDGAEMYVSVKPCAMCREAIKRARIEKVYYAAGQAKESTHNPEYINIKEFRDKGSDMIREFFAGKRE